MNKPTHGGYPDAEPSEPYKWPKLSEPARVGGFVFRPGVSTRLVVDRALREHKLHVARAPLTAEEMRNRRALWDLIHGGLDAPKMHAAICNISCGMPAQGCNCGFEQPAPINMVLHCPKCGRQHIDAPDTDYDPHYEGHMIWTNPPHRSHLCHGCGWIWRPADVPTNGVAAVKTKGKADS